MICIVYVNITKCKLTVSSLLVYRTPSKFKMGASKDSNVVFLSYLYHITLISNLALASVLFFPNINMIANVKLILYNYSISKKLISRVTF